MKLGRIKNVRLSSSTKTTQLLGMMSQRDGGIQTLCMDMNMWVLYDESNLYSREKVFCVYLYLSDMFLVGNRKGVNSCLTFTDLKKNFTNRHDIDAKTIYTDVLLENICACVRKNLDMAENEQRDCFFEHPIIFQAQGNWVNRGWGHTCCEYLVGVKLYRLI